MIQNKSFNLVSLGCPKNRVDAERILYTMTRAGFIFTHQPEQAEILIINTCAFIEPAVEESIESVLEHRELNDEAILVVAGCLPLRYRGSLKRHLHEADLFVTPDQVAELPRRLESLLKTRPRSRRSTVAHGSEQRKKRGVPSDEPPFVDPDAGSRVATIPQDRLPAGEAYGPSPFDEVGSCGRILTTPGYAYLKIADGCSRHCRFCTIPSIRGPLQSVDSRVLEEEAQALASQGVRELVLVAQDLTAYGADRREKGAFLELLKRLRQVQGIRWIRLMYLHPEGIPRGISEIINESENILPYLDIPFQHVSDTVLRAMGRPWKGDRIRNLVDRLRTEIPGLVLRTTLMVGFPGEGDQEFAELAEFVASYAIDRVGVFTYSPEEGTPAHTLGDPVERAVKEARANEIRRIHSRFMEQRNRSKIGSLEQSLVEGISEETELLLQGRTWDQAPEV
ncbi:MAG: 30S ribosomal protein S12 methylthiotransferase RimO, partial [Deltaproteobacteria bacterium]